MKLYNEDDTESEIIITISTDESFEQEYLRSLSLLLDDIKGTDNFVDFMPIVMVSVAFLESFINSIFYDILNNQYKSFCKKIDCDLIKNMYKDFNWEKLSILDKYHFLLKYAKLGLINGDNRYRKVKKIIELRNLLVHARPYRVYSDATEECDIIVKLLQNEFKVDTPSNSLNNRYSTYTGYQGACWVINTIIEFYKYFWGIFSDEELPYKNRIKQILDKISQN